MTRLFWMMCSLWVLLLAGCDKKPQLNLIYENDFSSGKLGSEWQKEGGHWEIKDGTLISKKAMNKDLILLKELPAEGAIEVDLISHSPQVDIKIRAWGDKRNDMHDGAYHFILGGWNNTISTIAPLGEHDNRRVEKREALKSDHWYKVRIERYKGEMKLFLDGKPFMSYTDSDPLDMAFYKYFSFANWKTDCAFDNVKIYAYQ